ncbi:MAG: hypothetical protein IPF99_00215 [Deltaproteobacteria bacterium]|nr:hypothetical protein [Deltaproteobacteria bacterium]
MPKASAAGTMVATETSRSRMVSATRRAGAPRSLRRHPAKTPGFVARCEA